MNNIQKTPLYQLKRQAKQLVRLDKTTHIAALNFIANEKGYKSWTLLLRAYEDDKGAGLFRKFKNGDLILLGARPGQGKTLLSLKIANEAINLGRNGIFFTLEYSQRQVKERIEKIGAELNQWVDRFAIDTSEDISAQYVINTMTELAVGSFAIIDYLQLLDQRRDKPPLGEQITRLKAFAERQKIILIFITQIDRKFEMSERDFPDLSDIRMPNPIDLTLFAKVGLLHEKRFKLHDLSI